MNDTPPPSPLPATKSSLGMISLCVLVTFVCVAALGIASRAQDQARLQQTTLEAAIQPVSVITAPKGAPTETLVLPGTVQAWHEAIIYARTGGYLKEWKVDIGTHVTLGQVLAVIDAPDLDAQFHQAQADLNTAIANNNIAQLTAKRYSDLRKTDSISIQQADQATAAAAAAAAAVESAKANLDHLQQQENFKQITAPFDGTITQRNIDIGALINGGNSATNGQDMFHIADTSKLRVFVQVPENNAAAIKPDLKAELHFPEQPSVTASATLDHSANALDPTTRTLQTEFQVDNGDDKLMPGGYADVHLQLPSAQDTILLPVNALLFRDGLQVAVVDATHHVLLKKIGTGRDFGKNIEIISGLNAGDVIVINPPDSLQNGQEVNPIPQSQVAP